MALIHEYFTDEPARKPVPAPAIRARHVFVALFMTFGLGGLIWADPMGALTEIAADDLSRGHYIQGVTP